MSASNNFDVLLPPKQYHDANANVVKSVSSWLMNGSTIKSNPPKIQFDNLSIHILDQGYGPSACITIRQIDDEKTEQLPLHAKSKLGVLGRILSGVRLRIFEVIEILSR